MAIPVKKSEQLQALFSRISGPCRESLIMTIKAAMADGEESLPFEDLLVLLGHEDFHDERWKALFSVVHPLVRETVQRCDQIAEAFLRQLWEYYLRDMDSQRAAAWLSGEEDIFAVRKAIIDGFKPVLESKSKIKDAKLRFVSRHVSELEMLLSLMARAEEIEDFFSGWPEQIKDLDDTYIIPLRDFNDHLIADSPEITPYLLFLAKARLRHSYQIFRAVEKVTRHANDRIMTNTELKLVGDALLDENECWLDAFSWETGKECDAASLVTALKNFIELTQGWSSEFDIDPSGPWGKRLSGQRARCARQWDSYMKRIGKIVDQIMPRKRGTATGRKTMPDVARVIEQHDIALAENAIGLLREAQGYASQGGFQFSKDKTVQLLESRLEEQGDDLLTLFGRKEEADHAQVSAHFAILVSMTKAFRGEAEANVLVRRGTVAMAA